MGEPAKLGERGPEQPARPLLLCLLASLAAHVGIIAFVVGSPKDQPPVNPVREPLSVILQNAAATPVEEPAPTTPAPARAPAAQENDAPVAEPLPEERPAVAAPSPPDPIDDDLDAPIVDLRDFVEDYTPSDGVPRALPFRPDLSRRIEQRKAEQRREAAVRSNLVQRYGHEQDVIDSTGTMARIGNNCYSISAPLITIQRGQQVTRVDCPGKLLWWAREPLDEIAQYRGIP